MLQKNMPKLIEVIGLPGSGKSFISSELETIKKNNEQIFFHSGNYNKNNKYKSINGSLRFLIHLKVISKIIIFYLIFFKRIFLKKIYKGSFFFRVISLFYKHLIYIEILKKKLENNEYLILEPGPIMYFIQDYFYINEDLSYFEIRIFNKFFLKTDYIINLECNSKDAFNRLKSRKRGLPSRMVNLNDQKIESALNKAKKIINDYIVRSKYLNLNIINIDSTNSAGEIKKKILESI